jgi:ribonuclease P protein subunit RPR2
MVRIARERVSGLFQLADTEASHGHGELADRYVTLARRIGMRYNVRLPSEFRELYCRRCSAFWIEGRTVRTRLRGGRRVRTCLRCGEARRVPLRRIVPRATPPLAVTQTQIPREEGVLAVDSEEEGPDSTMDESEEE